METGEERLQLRSLSLGEIFDRATTMYVRHVVPFTLIVFTLLAPLAVLRFAALGASADDYTQLANEILHPGTTPTIPVSLIGAVFGLGLLTLLLAPFVNNAVACGVAARDDGEPLRYGAAFARVFARWLPLVGTLLLCGSIIFGVYVALILVVFVVAAIGAASFAASGVAGVVMIVLGALVAIAFIATFAVVVMVCLMALYATTIEAKRPPDAISQAFARIFNRRELWKALLFTLAYVALELIAMVVSASIAAFMMYALHNLVLVVAFGTIANAMLSAYVTILLAVYYFDVRTRAEGLDLEMDLARLSSPA